MNNNLNEFINFNELKTVEERKAAIREVLQSIVLIGLSKANFFSVASFYGGTALRIFYNLHRYSEDLDFTLNEKDENFSFEPYINSIKEVAASYSLSINIDIKNKNEIKNIESAFLKVNTYKTLIELSLNDEITSILHKDEVMKVKFEVDINPPLGFNTEIKYIDIPEFANVIVLDLPSLFANKIVDILCRSYKNTVKGRDYYDFIFFIKKRVTPNMNYLKNKLIENKKIKEKDEFNIDIIINMLIDKFNSIDFKEVIKDLDRFIFKNEDLSNYSKDLFIELAKSIKYFD